MLNSRTVTWIIENVSGEYVQSELDTSICALDLFLEFDKDNPRDFTTIIEDMATANDREKPLQVKNFTDIERFMKILYELLNPGAMDLPPNDHSSSWMLADMYKQAFQVVNQNTNLAHAVPENYRNTQGYVYYYLIIYQYRNALTHEHTVNVTPKQMAAIVTAMLICMLDLCRKNQTRLEALMRRKKRRESFDQKAFCQKLVDEYQALVKKGFGYVDVHWYRGDETGKDDYNIEGLLNKKSFTCVKLLGEAGTGKSTALRRIEYLLACAAANGKKNVIPIYIELGTLADGDKILLGRIAAQMKLDTTMAEDFLKSGELCLLLDGFNEVLDLNVKKKLARELDVIAASYSKTRLILTDRAVARASIPTLVLAEKLYLSPITMGDRRKYFEKNCADKATLEMILRQMDTNPAYFEGMNTPLKLKRLADVAAYRGELPVDITDEYVSYLMEREMNEKKDANIEYLSTFLQALAIMNEDEISMLAASAQLAKCKNILGYSQPDTLQCLKLAIDMGLLTSEETNTVRFASEEYKDYFFMEGVANQLDQFLG